MADPYKSFAGQRAEFHPAPPWEAIALGLARELAAMKRRTAAPDPNDGLTVVERKVLRACPPAQETPAS